MLRLPREAPRTRRPDFPRLSILQSSVALGRKLHHPAARIFSRGGELNCVALLKHFESGVPEFQVKDFAFLREQVEIDAQAVEGAQMAVHDGGGDYFAGFRGVAMALFDFFQSLIANFEARFVFGEPLRDAGVKVPAEVVEFGRGGQRFYFGERFFFEMEEAEDHVSDLHAGVVDVVLHFDAASGMA